VTNPQTVVPQKPLVYGSRDRHLAEPLLGYDLSIFSEDRDLLRPLADQVADLAMETFDEEGIRADLRQAFQITRNCRVEVIMKDNHTIGKDPSRAARGHDAAAANTELREHIITVRL